MIFCFLPFLIFLCYSGGSWYCRIQGRSWTQRRNCKLWSTFSVYLIHLWSWVYPGLGQKLSPVTSSCCLHPDERNTLWFLPNVGAPFLRAVTQMEFRGCNIISALLKKNATILHCRDLLVFKDLPDNKVKKERGGPGVSLVLLDLLDHLERE